MNTTSDNPEQPSIAKEPAPQAELPSSPAVGGERLRDKVYLAIIVALLTFAGGVAGVPMTIVSRVDNALMGIGGNFADLTGADWRLAPDGSKADRIRQNFTART